MSLRSRIWLFVILQITAFGLAAFFVIDMRDKAFSQNETIFIVIALCALGFILSYLGTKIILQPVKKLLAGMQKVSSGEFVTTTDIYTKDETGEVARLLNSISKKVASSVDMTTFEKKKLDTILQSIGDAVVVLDEWKNITLVNRVTEELSGFTHEELLGKKYQEYLHIENEDKEQANISFIEEVFKHGSVLPPTGHTLIVNKKGDKIPIAITAAPIFGASAITGCVVIFRDITRERSVEKMKDEFVSLASHQLRTPLTALRWLTEKLQNDNDPPLSPEQKETVTNMRESTLRLIQLVNDLLNVGRIEAGRLIVEPCETDLKKLTETMLSDVSPRLIEKNQTVDLTADNLPHLSIDPKLVGQVIQNLITNASKYSPDNDKIKIDIAVEQDFIKTKVSDSGCGIPEAEQARLFSKFFRATNATAYEGTGLGLYLAKEIVEVSGGQIGFTSPIGTDAKGKPCGTEFWFTLPLAGSQAKKGEVSLA